MDFSRKAEDRRCKRIGDDSFIFKDNKRKIEGAKRQTDVLNIGFQARFLQVKSSNGVKKDHETLVSCSFQEDGRKERYSYMKQLEDRFRGQR